MLAAVGFAACGGSTNVNPRAYTSNLCNALKTYLTDIQKNGSAVQAALGANASPANGKRQLSTFLDKVISSTDTLVSNVKSAGTPDVPNGAELATKAADALEQVKTGLEGLRDDVDGIPTNNPQTFQTAPARVSKQMGQVFAQSGKALDKLKSPELESATKANRTCQSLSS